MFRQAGRALSTSATWGARYGGRHTAVLIPGDGIGPEMAQHLRDTFNLIKAPIDFENHNLTGENYHHGEIDNAIKAIRRSGAAIKGNIHTNLNEPGKARNLRIRTELDLFANVIHAKSYDAVETRHKNVDIYLVRENTEGEYAGLEHESVDGVVECLKIITQEKCERIARFAFDFARSHNRKKVTAIHKANIMKMADGLFLKVCREVSADYPDIAFDDMIVDNTCMQLVSNPWQFDVMVMPNLYGAVVGNVCCGLVGGPGITAGSNYSETLGVFEMATRNTGASIKGANLANPSSILLAGVKLLEYYGLRHHSDIIKQAVIKTINVDKVHTPDIGGNSSTNDMMVAIHDNIKESLRDATAFQKQQAALHES